MSMNNLTIDGEFRYIVQWFKEWSELQRDDFVPILVEYLTSSHNNDDYDDDDGLTAVAVAKTQVNMNNGLLNESEHSEKPMSLFQCRIKLFNQWNRRWPAEFKEKLRQKIFEIDNTVGGKVKLCINTYNMTNHLTNGYALNEQQFSENASNLAIIANNAESTGAMPLNDPLTEVLNNETSVDENETHKDANNCIEQPLFNNTVINTLTAPIYTGINNVSLVAPGNGNNEVFCNNTRYNTINEHGAEPVEQAVQMQFLQINEERAESEKDHEDVISTIEQNQELQTNKVAINPIVVAQTITTNTEVPSVV